MEGAARERPRPGRHVAAAAAFAFAPLVASGMRAASFVDAPAWIPLPGPAGHAGLGFVLGLVILGALPVGGVALVLAAASRRLRQAALIWLLAAPAACVSLLLGLALEKHAREPAIGLAARAFEPVLDALEAERREGGRYPETLEALVPARLPAIPSPGGRAIRVSYDPSGGDTGHFVLRLTIPIFGFARCFLVFDSANPRCPAKPAPPDGRPPPRCEGRFERAFLD